MTDDDRFGFVIERSSGRGMFRFQLVLDGLLIGDEEPCILGSAMNRLKNLHHVTDERLAEASVNPRKVLSVLRSNDELHDLTALSIAESLDQWLIYGFAYASDVVLLAQPHSDESATTAAVSVSVVSAADYASLLGAAYHYWRS